MGKDSVLVNLLPLYHVFGFTGGSLLATVTNATSVYPAPGFNANASLIALDSYKGTLFSVLITKDDLVSPFYEFNKLCVKPCTYKN